MFAPSLYQVYSLQIFNFMFAHSFSKDSLVLGDDLIQPLTHFYASLACHRPSSTPFWGGGVLHKNKNHAFWFTLGLPCCGKLGVNQNAWFTCLEGHIKYAVPSLYGAGSARSGFATCLPVPWGGWGPLVRAKQAVFRVLNFQKIGVLTCLATAVESARVIRTGSYLAHLSFNTCCTRHICVCRNQTISFGCLGLQI